MNEIKVSIIIPIYNGEKYIKNLVQQLEQQNQSGLEVVFVNDGSKDNSLNLLKQIKEGSELSFQMTIVDQENGGICKARNKGLGTASGQYIVFMDQDDGIKANAIQTLLKNMEEQNADIVLGGFELIDKEQNVLETWILDPEDPWSVFRINAPWARMFRKSIIDEHNIRFFITKISEDFYFNYRYISYCNNIVVSEDIVYQWLLNEKSESHANMSQYSIDRNVYQMLTALQQDMNKNYTVDRDCVEYGMIKHVTWYMFYVAKSTSKEVLTQIHDEGIAWLKKYYPKYYKNPYLRIGKPKTEAFGSRMAVKIAVLLERLHILNLFLHIYADNLFK